MTTSFPPELQVELTFFYAHRDEWLKDHREKWALVKGEELVDTFDSAENAYEAGVERYGTESFLVKQIIESDPVAEIPVLSIGLLSSARS